MNHVKWIFCFFHTLKSLFAISVIIQWRYNNTIHVARVITLQGSSNSNYQFICLALLCKTLCTITGESTRHFHSLKDRILVIRGGPNHILTICNLVRLLKKSNYICIPFRFNKIQTSNCCLICLSINQFPPYSSTQNLKIVNCPLIFSNSRIP